MLQLPLIVLELGFEQVEFLGQLRDLGHVPEHDLADSPDDLPRLVPDRDPLDDHVLPLDLLLPADLRLPGLEDDVHTCVLDHLRHVLSQDLLARDPEKVLVALAIERHDALGVHHQRPELNVVQRLLERYVSHQPSPPPSWRKGTALAGRLQGAPNRFSRQTVGFE